MSDGSSKGLETLPGDFSVHPRAWKRCPAIFLFIRGLGNVARRFFCSSKGLETLPGDFSAHPRPRKRCLAIFLLIQGLGNVAW